MMLKYVKPTEAGGKSMIKAYGYLRVSGKCEDEGLE
jgi:hypothetical protein